MLTRWRAAAATVAMAAGLTAAAPLPASAASQTAKAVTVTISASAREPKIGGDVIVFFRSGSFSTATIKGTISGAASGDLAILLGQQFPYKKAPAQVGKPITLTGSAQSYSFTVTPTIATKYRVQVTSSGKPVATSAVQIVYVSAGGSFRYLHLCTQSDRPICHQKVVIFTVVPRAALRAISAKRFLFYFGLKLSRTAHVPLVKYLFLDARASISKARRITSTKFANTISWAFRVGNDAYRWRWTACTRDTEAKDGYGLPGHHQCGNRRLTVGKFIYLG